MPPTIPARERSFADTGFFALPVEIFDASLSIFELAVYCLIACEADKGANPPTLNLMARKTRMPMETVEEVLETLKRRNMLVIRSTTEWELTEPASWTP